LASQLRTLGQEIEGLERQILESHWADAASRRLVTIPRHRPDHGWPEYGAYRIALFDRRSLRASAALSNPRPNSRCITY
jgi:hypothetical protein